MTSVQDALAAALVRWDVHSWHHPERELPQGRECLACEMLACVEDEIARLERRVETEIDMRREASQAVLFAIERAEAAEAAEAEVARLRDGLREIAGYGISRPTPEWEPVVSADVVKIARALLADDGAA